LKRGITLELAVMPMVPLMVAIVMERIFPGIKKL
jgi:hypothetical protein